jgi:hypothetical protein
MQAAASYDRRRPPARGAGIYANAVAVHAGLACHQLGSTAGETELSVVTSLQDRYRKHRAWARFIQRATSGAASGLGLFLSPMVFRKMPRFFYDFLGDGDTVMDPEGVEYESLSGAIAAADNMARHLFASRGKPRGGGGTIRIRNEGGQEVYRSAIDPDPAVHEST